MGLMGARGKKMKTGMLLTLMYSLGALIKKDKVVVPVNSEKIAEDIERQEALSKDYFISKRNQKKVLGKKNRKNRGRKR